MKKNGTGMIKAAYALLVAACILIAGATFFFDRTLFYIVFPAAVIIAVVSLLLILRVRHEIYGMVKSVNQHLKPGEHTGVSFPMPVIVVSENREIIWYNDLFESGVADSEEVLGMSFDSISDLPLERFCTAAGAEVSYGGKSYIAYGICDAQGEKIYMLYFSETTALKKLADQYLLTRPAVMLILGGQL